MQFNKLLLSFILWTVVGFVGAIASFFRRYRLSQEHKTKLCYMQQLLRLAGQGFNMDEILKELYYFFIRNKRLRVVLLRAMGLSTINAYNYIYKKLGCEPMRQIHAYLISRIGRNYEKNNSEQVKLSSETIDCFQKLINEWDDEAITSLKYMKKRKIAIWFEINCMLMSNLFLYYKLQTEISLLTLVIVNTIGVALYIILDYECCIVDRNKNDGKLAPWKNAKKRTHTPAKGFQYFYQLVGGMGLIINISMFVLEWLGPVA